MTAFDDFLDVLRKYQNLLTWVIGSAVLPLAASQVDLTPPWPKGVVFLTTLWQALALVLAFQLGQRVPRRVANKAIAWAAILTVACSIAYYAALSQLTFEGGAARERLVKGFVCTPEAILLEKYHRKCPFLDDRLINGAESPEQLWTTSSITASRLTLLSLWLLVYDRSRPPSRYS
jgi:hypothetical protein